MLWSDLCVIRMINDDHLIYNTKGKSFKYLVWQINILLAGRQWTVKIVSHWTLQRNLETHFNCVPQPFHFNVDSSKYSMAEAGLTQRPPNLLSECICQSAVRTDIMRHLIVSAPHIPQISRHLSYGSTSQYSGFYEQIKLWQEVSATGESRDKCLHNQHPIYKYCWYCQRVVCSKKVEGN